MRSAEEATVAAAPDAREAFVAAFFDELQRSGVDHVCVSPGSRSTPLAVAAARCSGLRCWSHLDERSAGFFALGLARASAAPVALVCTSGTAAANYLPAVVEAHYARVPLLVLTADRPPELREWGAGQTIDQLALYGRHVRRFVELPVPEPGPGPLRYARSLACRAVAEAMGPPAGPVHLNWPLREPLEPVSDRHGAVDFAAGDTLAGVGRPSRPYAEVRIATPRVSEEQRSELVALVRGHERGVVVCGPAPPVPGLAQAVAELARKAGWPMLADATSQLRRGPHCANGPVIAHADLLLRDAEFAAGHAPEVVLRVGDTPVSKAQRLWLEAAPPKHLLLVDPDGGWNEPSHLASGVLRVDPLTLCRDLARELGEPRESEWLRSMLAADRIVGRAVTRAISAESALLEPRAVQELARLLPDVALLYVSNSMPVRDLDAFLPACERPLTVLCNRGANGIDGVLSSALGAAAAGRGPVVLLTGDLAFLHDLGGLLAAKRHDLSLTIVLLNNDGGGIFSFLPIAEYGEAVDFEDLFRVSHGLDFSHAAALFGMDYSRVQSWPEFRAAVERSMASVRTSLIELPVERDANVQHFRELVRVASLALSSGAMR